VASALPGSFRSASTLQEVLAAQVPAKQAELLALKKEHGDKVIGQVTVDQLIGGARGIKSMLWETSNLDANEGIRFRGYTIPECQQILPTYSGVAGDGEPTLEAIFWLLLTGEVPTKAQCDSLTAELHKRVSEGARASERSERAKRASERSERAKRASERSERAKRTSERSEVWARAKVWTRAKVWA
jgi:citrate synthase